MAAIWINDIPLFWSFIIFVILIVLFCVAGLFIFQRLALYKLQCPDQSPNFIFNPFLSIVSIFFAILMSYLIVTIWGNYDKSKLNTRQEADNLYLLYSSLNSLPNTEDIQQSIVRYTEFIINNEFPAGNSADVIEQGNVLLRNIQKELYNYNPEGQRQGTLYDNSISIFNLVSTNKIDRAFNAQSTVNPLLLIVTIIDALLLIIMTWLLKCGSPIHYILEILMATFIATGFFIIIVLSSPFSGYFALSAQPYIYALAAMRNLN